MSLFVSKKTIQSISVFLCLLLLCCCNISNNHVNNDISVPPYIDISNYSFSNELENSIMSIETDNMIYVNHDDILLLKIDTSQCLPVFNVNLNLEDYIILQKEANYADFFSSKTNYLLTTAESEKGLFDVFLQIQETEIIAISYFQTKEISIYHKYIDFWHNHRVIMLEILQKYESPHILFGVFTFAPADSRQFIIFYDENNAELLFLENFDINIKSNQYLSEPVLLLGDGMKQYKIKLAKPYSVNGEVLPIAIKLELLYNISLKNYLIASIEGLDIIPLTDYSISETVDSQLVD